MSLVMQAKPKSVEADFVFFSLLSIIKKLLMTGYVDFTINQVGGKNVIQK